MGNRFLLVLGAIAVLFFGLLMFNKKDSVAPSTNTQPSNHVIGAGNAGVTLIEYGDYQCPFCGTFHPVIKQVIEKYGDKITFQFRNFPLTQLHKNAMAAHRAAEAADKQGKFWQMHDMLYENQKSWESSNTAATIFEAFAKELGLNIDQFRADVNSTAVNDVIQADIVAGQNLRINSTPTFILNGNKIENARDNLEFFSEKIDAAIAEKAKQ